MLDGIDADKLEEIRGLRNVMTKAIRESLEARNVVAKSKFRIKSSAPASDGRDPSKGVAKLDRSVYDASRSVTGASSFESVSESIHKRLPDVSRDVRLRDSFSQHKELSVIPAAYDNDTAGNVPTLVDGRHTFFNLDDSFRSTIVARGCERPVPVVDESVISSIETHSTDLILAADRAAKIIAGVDDIKRGRGHRSNISTEKLRDIAMSLRVSSSGTKQELLARIREKISQATASEEAFE